MIYDPSASVPAVLLAKNYVSSSTTYMYIVREPGGELLCSFDASETPNKYYYHFDDLGSTVLVTNGSGSVSDSFTYGAWGDVLNSPTNDRKPYQYVGQLGYYRHFSAQGTALADLMELGLRFYDSEIGRFTQRDPIWSGVLPTYGYADGQPTVLYDPQGLLAGRYKGCEKWCNGKSIKDRIACWVCKKIEDFGCRLDNRQCCDADRAHCHMDCEDYPYNCDKDREACHGYCESRYALCLIGGGSFTGPTPPAK